MADGPQPFFTDSERGTLDIALEEPPEVGALTAAYRLLVEKLRPLAPEGWVVNGAELAPVIFELYVMADRADDQAVMRIDPADSTSDEAVAAEMGGMVFALGDWRYWRPASAVEMNELRYEVRSLESAAGVIGREDANGDWSYGVAYRDGDL